MARTARKAAGKIASARKKPAAKKPAKKAPKDTGATPADAPATGGDDPFGDRAWLTGKRAKGPRAAATPAYVLPESRDEEVSGLKLRELESMVAGAVDIALEDKRRGAPKGNRFWEARSSHGRKPKFARAADLETACCEYFAWVEEHPLHEEVLVTHMGDVWHDTRTKMRPMTLEGLCLFIDIDTSTWAAWRHPETGRRDLSGVIAWVETVIRTQKFEGAAAGFLNANIISRDLGLADKTAGTLEAGDTLKTFLGAIAGAPLFGGGR